MDITYKKPKKKKNSNNIPDKMVQVANDNSNAINSINNFLPKKISDSNFSPTPFSPTPLHNADNLSIYRNSVPKEVWLKDCSKGGLMAGKSRRLESVARKILDQKPNLNEKALMEELGEEIDDEADAREILLRCCKNYGMNGNVKYAELLLKASGEMPKESQMNLLQVNNNAEKVMNIFDTINEIQYNK